LSSKNLYDYACSPQVVLVCTPQVSTFLDTRNENHSYLDKTNKINNLC